MNLPSPSLLRQWAADPEQQQCWGLNAVADELERLRAGEPTVGSEFDAIDLLDDPCYDPDDLRDWQDVAADHAGVSRSSEL